MSKHHSRAELAKVAFIGPAGASRRRSPPLRSDGLAYDALLRPESRPKVAVAILVGVVSILMAGQTTPFSASAAGAAVLETMP